MLHDLVRNFIASMIADEKSECTIKAYKSDLSGFEDYVFSIQKTFQDIKYPDLRKWADEMSDAGLSATTRARKISSVKSFFKYLEKMGLIEQNPALGLDAPKLPKRQPKVISNTEAKNLLECTYHDHPSHITCFRDYTILAVFLFTGIRREELTNIKLDDVDLERETILIHGKGNKERMVYINEALISILSEYLRFYRRLFKTASTSKYLFPSIKSDKISPHAVNQVVNKAMETAGIKENGVSAHVLRKRFATTVFANTGDIATTSKLLGHSSPTVTMTYVAIDEYKMRHAASVVNF